MTYIIKYQAKTNDGKVVLRDYPQSTTITRKQAKKLCEQTLKRVLANLRKANATIQFEVTEE